MTDTDLGVQRSLGSLEAKVSRVENQLETVEMKLDKVVDTLAEFRGGKKVVLSLSAIAGGVMGYVATNIPTWLGKH